MVIKRSAMKTEKREKMRDGAGVAEITYLADAEKEKNSRLFAEITLNSGCSIGYHQHLNETEYFFVVSGKGIVNDDGKDAEVNAGDTIITGNGASHSIKNTGTGPLVLHAVIITNN